MMRKKQSLTAVCLMVTLMMLSGCGSKYFSWAEDDKNSFMSMLTSFWTNVRPVKDLAVAHYKLGRFYQQREQHRKSVIEFRKAVHSDPEYVNAYNALGVAYDTLHEYENAELAYRKAIALDPERAYLHNNLGYSYLRRGDSEAAVSSLEKAAALSDDNARIKNNLQLARAKSIENEQAPENLAALASNIKKKEIAPLLSFSNVPIHKVYSEQIPGKKGREQMLKENDRLFAGIEVINGNGVEGMARRTAGYLKRHGLEVRKISNASHFNMPKTEIYYQNGYLQEAYRLSSFIPGHQDYTKMDSLSSAELHVKLVLGQDMIPNQKILQ